MRGLIEAVAMLALALIGAVALRVHLWEDGTLPLADASARAILRGADVAARLDLDQNNRPG